jgi:hypothetical protein
MHAVRAVVFFLLTAALAGCGGAELGEVSGNVSYDGAPIEEGAISFIPTDGKGPSGGAMIKGGKYTAKNVALGLCKVSISSGKVSSQKADDMKGPTSPKIIELVPSKYNKSTELQFDVKAGSQTKDFDLPK